MGMPCLMIIASNEFQNETQQEGLSVETSHPFQRYGLHSKQV